MNVDSLSARPLCDLETWALIIVLVRSTILCRKQLGSRESRQPLLQRINVVFLFLNMSAFPVLRAFIVWLLLTVTPFLFHNDPLLAASSSLLSVLHHLFLHFTSARN